MLLWNTKKIIWKAILQFLLIISGVLSSRVCRVVACSHRRWADVFFPGNRLTWRLSSQWPGVRRGRMPRAVVFLQTYRYFWGHLDRSIFLWLSVWHWQSKLFCRWLLQLPQQGVDVFSSSGTPDQILAEEYVCSSEHLPEPQRSIPVGWILK